MTMLTVLSGADTLPVKLLANQIVAATNQFTVSGLDVKFDGLGNYQILNGSDVVYRVGDDSTDSVDTLIHSNGGRDVIQEVDQLKEEIFLREAHANYFRNVFVDIGYDYGVTSSPDYEGNKSYVDVPATYNDLLSNINNSPLTNHVISGCFSKDIIQRLTKDVGSDNIQVVSVIRNPSVMFVLNRRSSDNAMDSYFLSLRLHDTLQNSIILNHVDGIKTYRFEDILEEGGFLVGDVFVNLPSNVTSFNGLITNYEQQRLRPVGVREVEQWNDELQQFDLIKHMKKIEADPNIVDQDTEIAALHPLLPTNIFEELGYSPVDYMRIVTKEG